MQRIFHVQLKHAVPSTGRDHLNVKCETVVVDEDDYMFGMQGAVPHLFVPRNNVLFVEDLGEADAEVKEDGLAKAGEPSGS